MTRPDPHDSTGTADLRNHERSHESGAVRLTLVGGELDARVDNLSAGGVMVVSDRSVEVEVEIERDGERVTRRGRLVRVQRLNAHETAYAIEFED